jgi:hypothetical protein
MRRRASRKSIMNFLTMILPLFLAADLPPALASAAALPPSTGILDGSFTITVELTPGGAITVRREDGQKTVLGRVKDLPINSRWPSFTASAWGREQGVVASAVNAIHILLSVEKGKGRTISLLPEETIAPAAGPGAAIVTDIKAGRAVFGAWAPPVGSRVVFERSDGGPYLAKDAPRKGDVMKIMADPLPCPYFVELENRPGGRVTAWYGDGVRVLGRVIRPLGGTGRFDGTIFQDTGRIRANHPGVIDVCTSPEGLVGGFQIIPLEHAFSREMLGAWKMTQWMIIGPEMGKVDLKGTGPLFSGGLLPGPARGEVLWDLWSSYGRKPLVLARSKGGPWGKMPALSGRQDHALEGITHLRIYYPFTMEPLRDGADPSHRLP